MNKILKKYKRKIIGIICICIIFINNIFALEIQDGNSYKVRDTGEIEKYFKYNNIEQKIHKYVYTLDENKEELAYCLDLNLTGPDKTYESKYDLKVEGLLGNGINRLPTTKVPEKNISNAITVGYPYVSKEELGVYSEDKAYVATQFAVWTIEEVIDKNSLQAMPGAEDVYNAYLKILERYNSKEFEQMHVFNLEKIDEKFIEEPKNKVYFSQRFKVDSNLKVESIKVKNSDKYKITDDNLQEISEIKIGEIFKIVMLKKDANSIEEANLELDIKYNSNIVYFGVAPEGNYQNMGLCINPQKEYNITEKIEIEKVKIPVQITKIDSKTKEKLQGAVFEIINEDGDTVANLITNEKGEAIYILEEEGKYTVKETKAPDGYYLGETKNIEAKYNEKIYLEFSNDKYSSINIIKKDGETNIGIEGVEFEIEDEEKNIIKEITDKDGKIVLSNLKKGTYIIRETKEAKNYQLSKLEHIIKLDVGETKYVEVFNYKTKEEISEGILLPKTGY